MSRKFPPFFASAEEAQRAYIACGRVALSWGPVELTMESQVLKLRSRFDRITEGIPVSFNKKWKELKDLLRDAGHADAFRDLMTEAKRIHRLRTIVVHSLCQGTNIKGELMFGHSDSKAGVLYTEHKMTIPEVEKLADDMRELRDGFEQALRQAGLP